jgi:putative Mg2+ transporter-C (MgtC) family protein
VSRAASTRGRECPYIVTGVSDSLSHLANLFFAYLLALPIGWDRERADRSAGIRTFPLVAVASCGFVLASQTILKQHPEGNARIIEGVITGMGFIGGGAILKTEGAVRGTATAASLWATGAIGVASAVQTYDIAIIISAITLFTLRVLAPFKAPTNPDR